jgi:hypothetical protein
MITLRLPANFSEKKRETFARSLALFAVGSQAIA